MELFSALHQDKIEHKQSIVTSLERLEIIRSRLINFPMCRADLGTASLAQLDEVDGSPAHRPGTAISSEHSATHRRGVDT